MTSANAVPPGRVIVLNGSSSAGKTTLAQALQVNLEGAWQHMALDHFRDGMSPRYRGLNSPAGTPGAAGLNVVPIDMGGERVTSIQFGEQGQRVLRGMHRAIAAFALAGNDVIVDDLIWDQPTLDDYLDALLDLHVWFVGVRCSRSVVEAREAQRAGRFPGTATSHFDSVHAWCRYDLEVDTSEQTPAECAVLVRECLARPAEAHRQMLEARRSGTLFAG